MLDVQIFPSGPVQTNTLLLSCSKTKEAAAIDPALGSAELVIAYAKKHHLKGTKIILTHSHWDHIADLKVLVDAWGSPVYVHPADAANVEAPGSDGLSSPFSIQGVKGADLIHEGDTIPVGDSSLRVIETPGHTPGGICLYDESAGILISGDTLFQHSYGRLDLPTATPKDMIQSLEKLSKLPPSTVVYPGHGPNTTIGEERWIKNPRRSLKM